MSVARWPRGRCAAPRHGAVRDAVPPTQPGVPTSVQADEVGKADPSRSRPEVSSTVEGVIIPGVLCLLMNGAWTERGRRQYED